MVSFSLLVTAPLSVLADGGITLSSQSITLNMGTLKTLKAIISPSNATDKNVTWASSDPAVVTVNPLGSLYPVSLGSATITATTEDGGLTATCTVTVQTGVNAITLDKKTDTILVGATDTLNATITPDSATDTDVTWKSSNPLIASVDTDGEVTAVAPGTVTITATSQDGTNKSASCKVIVPAIPVSVTNVSINKSTLTLNIGKPQTLSAIMSPTNATDKIVTWASGNTVVAAVYANGEIMPLSVGTTTITATTDDGGFTTSCAITVQQGVGKLTLNETKDTISAGTTDTLTATVTPTNATNTTVAWALGKPAVASVDQNGVVTAYQPGSAIITATSKDGTNVKATCTVTVPNPVISVSLSKQTMTVNMGTTQTIRAILTPSGATDKIVTWDSSDPTIASIDANGKITHVSDGTATITATTDDGGDTATCDVTVQTAVTKITLNKTTDTITNGTTDTLAATITPDDATTQDVTWKSSNPLIASVDTNGVITAVASGTVTISATSQDGTNKSASCRVVVPVPVSGVNFQ